MDVKTSFRVVRRGDLNALRLLALGEGNYSDEEVKDRLRCCRLTPSGDTLAHAASHEGQARVLQFLLDVGLCLDLPNSTDRKTPLHVAAQQLQVECVELLLKADHSPDPLRRGDWTPLMCACASKASDICHLSQASGDSSHTNQAAVINLLLTWKASPLLRNKDGWTPLHLACRSASFEAIEAIVDWLKRRDELNQSLLARSNNGRSLLHTIALHGRTRELVHLIPQPLLATLANAEDRCGSTPLKEAELAEDVEGAEIINSILNGNP